MTDVTGLRATFPDAPGTIAAPADVRTLFSERMRTVGGGARTPLIVVAGLLLAFSAFAFASARIPEGGVALAIVVVSVIGIAAYQYSQATSDFYTAYASARGLDLSTNTYIPGGVRLQCKGDKRKYERVMTGRICGVPAHLGTYTYTEVSTDSDGNRQESDYHFTLLRYGLPDAVVARFAGVSLGPKTFSFGALQDTFMNDRKVELESQEFHKRYSLRVRDEQDDVALYELFHPAFVDALTRGAEVYWQQLADDLVFWKKGHEHEADDLDEFCANSGMVLRRYLEEDQ